MKPLVTIGRAERIDLPDLGIKDVPARIDTGAKTSAIWVSAAEVKDRVLLVTFFGPSSQFFDGQQVAFEQFSKLAVASSNGMVEERYKIKLKMQLSGKKINASFTLADRSTQVYPVLVGRNVLSGKFLINPKLGTPLVKEEKNREKTKKEQLKKLSKQ